MDLEDGIDSAADSLGIPHPISGSELWAQEFSAPLWLVDSIWPEQSCGFLSGPSGARKTWIALELSISVSTGKPALGQFASMHPGTVLYIAGEDHLKNLQSRMKLLALGRGIGSSELGNLRFSAEQGLLTSEASRARLEGYCESLRPRLIVLDPLVRMHGADENSAREFQPILAFLRYLQRTYGVSLLLTHHVRKHRGDERGAGRKMEWLRGTGDLGAWADTVIMVDRHGEDGEAPSRVVVAKQRDVPEADPFMLTLEIGPAAAKLIYHPGDDVELTTLEIMQRMVEALSESPNQEAGLLKMDLEEVTRGSSRTKRAAFERLLTQGQIQVQVRTDRAKNGSVRKRKFVRLVRSTPVHLEAQGSPGIALRALPTPVHLEGRVSPGVALRALPTPVPLEGRVSPGVALRALPTPVPPLGGTGVAAVSPESEAPPGPQNGSSASRQAALSLQDFSVSPEEANESLEV